MKASSIRPVSCLIKLLPVILFASSAAAVGAVNVVAVGDSITVGTGASIQPPQISAPLGVTSSTITNGTDWGRSPSPDELFSKWKSRVAVRAGQPEDFGWTFPIHQFHGINRRRQSRPRFDHRNPDVDRRKARSAWNGCYRHRHSGQHHRDLFRRAGDVLVVDRRRPPVTSLTVIGPTTGIVNGMFAVSETLGAGGLVGDIEIFSGTTITISGNTITLSIGAAAYGSGFFTGKIYFVSPNVTLSKRLYRDHRAAIDEFRRNAGHVERCIHERLHSSHGRRDDRIVGRTHQQHGALARSSRRRAPPSPSPEQP